MPYVVFNFLNGTSDFGLINTVFVPLIRFPTPCASLPNSFANERSQIILSEPLSGCLYCMVFPVSGFLITLHISVSPAAAHTHVAVIGVLCVSVGGILLRPLTVCAPLEVWGHRLELVAECDRCGDWLESVKE